MKIESLTRQTAVTSDLSEILHGLRVSQKFKVFGNLRGREVMWGYFCGSTTKIPPHLPHIPAIPREPNIKVFKPAIKCSRIHIKRYSHKGRSKKAGNQDCREIIISKHCNQASTGMNLCKKI
jgi:hypothetical protein